MGVNYYLKIKEEVIDRDLGDLKVIKKDIIDKCSYHIGKCSGGWRFMFQEQFLEGKKINSFGKWKDIIENDVFEIRNEYDEIVDKKEFFKMVEDRQKEGPHDYGMYGCYLSEDGYDFDVGEFS